MKDFGSSRTGLDGRLVRPDRLWRTSIGQFSGFSLSDLPHRKTTIVDLRDPAEGDSALRFVRRGLGLKNVPVWPRAQEYEVAEIQKYGEHADGLLPEQLVSRSMRDIYFRMGSEFVEQWIELILELTMSDSQRFIILCRRGVDRSGVAAFLLLSLLGVSDQEARDEYLSGESESIPPNEQLLDYFLQGLQVSTGGLEGLLSKLKKTDRKVVSRFQNKFLEKEI